MVNVGLSWSSMVGIALAIAGAALYFLRSVRPGLARDHDIFFAAVSLLCGGILFFQGWRQDPILQFGQFLLAGSTIFFAVESIRLRGVATEQAKQRTPVVDDDRPVSRVYRAELDELSPLDEQRTTARRIRGSRDSRPSQVDGYDDEVRRRPSKRSTTDRLGPGDDSPRGASSGSRKRRPRVESRSVDRSDIHEFWDDTEDKPSRVEEGPPRVGNREPGSTPRPKRNRPSRDRSSRRERDLGSSSDYVDYQPVDYSDDGDS